MLSFHLLFYLACLLPSFTVPCKIVLARADERETCPYHFRRLKLDWKLPPPPQKKKCKQLHFYTLCSCSINIYAVEVLLVRISAHQGALGSDSLLKSRKAGLWCNWHFCHTFAGFVHDITDTDCKTQNGSTQGHVQNRPQINKTDHKSTEKLCKCFFGFSPLRIHDTSWFMVPFKTGMPAAMSSLFGWLTWCRGQTHKTMFINNNLHKTCHTHTQKS